MPPDEWDLRAIPRWPFRPDAGSVEGPSIAHELPELYRAVLERCTSLELTGRRGEAELVRRAAVAAYSRAWDDAARHRLEQLRERAERVLDGHQQPRAPHAALPAIRRTRPA
jgi:hypothetical protein